MSEQPEQEESQSEGAPVISGLTLPQPEATPTPATSGSAKQRAREVLHHELNLTFDHAEKIIQQLERRGLQIIHSGEKSGIGGL